MCTINIYIMHVKARARFRNLYSVSENMTSELAETHTRRPCFLSFSWQRLSVCPSCEYSYSIAEEVYLATLKECTSIIHVHTLCVVPESGVWDNIT
jgi:hypothetical protein